MLQYCYFIFLQRGTSEDNEWWNEEATVGVAGNSVPKTDSEESLILIE